MKFLLPALLLPAACGKDGSGSAAVATAVEFQEVRGFSETTGADHMKHLHNVGELWKATSLGFR